MQVLITITLGVSLLQQAICHGEPAHLLALPPLASQESFRLILTDKKCQILQASQQQSGARGAAFTTSWLDIFVFQVCCTC